MTPARGMAPGNIIENKREEKMKRKQFLFIIALGILMLMVAACTPTSGGPEIGADDASKETVEDDVNNGLESTESDMTNKLAGIRWLLGSYANAAGETVAAMSDREVTLEFGADGRVSGSAGCNQYFAAYTVDESNLTISDAGSTMMACDPPEVMQQEADFLAALQSAATYSFDGEQLQIANADGATLLTFQAGQSASLTGTSWTATTYNTGTQAVTNLIQDTAITATFTEDGQLNGSAGCNTYMTSYTVDGQNITIQPPATTRKLCPEPEGIMDQEAAFVSMLPQAATYDISGNSLELRTADGALIAAFTAAQ